MKEGNLKGKTVTVKGKKYRMEFTKKKAGNVWTQIKQHGHKNLISSYTSDTKEQGYKKGMKWLRARK